MGGTVYLLDSEEGLRWTKHEPDLVAAFRTYLLKRVSNRSCQFSEIHEINFVSIYDEFKRENKRDFIFDNFIYGDIHWNLKGTKRVKDKIVESLKF